MKLSLLSVLIWMCGLPLAHAQGDSLCPAPESIRKSFNALHPQASDIYWETCAMGYRASFFENGKSQELLFSPQGRWVCAHTYLDQEEFPASVRKALFQRLPKGALPSLTYQVYQPGQAPQYRAVLQTREGLLELTFDSDGNLVTERLEAPR
jgi:hypothetical protein